MAKSDAKVLVVEADRVGREVLAGRLRRQDYWVATADTPQLALGILDVQDFDLVFLDADAGEINAPELIQRIRTEPNWSQIPVIVTTARYSVDRAARWLALGAEDCLAKPFHSGLLLARVASAIERKRQLDHAVAQGQILMRKLESLGQSTGEEIDPDFAWPLRVAQAAKVPLRPAGPDAVYKPLVK